MRTVTGAIPTAVLLAMTGSALPGGDRDLIEEVEPRPTDDAPDLVRPLLREALVETFDLSPPPRPPSPAALGRMAAARAKRERRLARNRAVMERNAVQAATGLTRWRRR